MLLNVGALTRAIRQMKARRRAQRLDKDDRNEGRRIVTKRAARRRH